MSFVRYLSLLILLVFTPLIFAEQYDFQTDQPIYVVGDVHGAYDEFKTLLLTAKLIDDELNWTGGKSHLVSLGDLLDRGPKSREAIDLLRRLQIQAELVGGKVHVILGNHELMILQGDWRYLSAEEIAAFADEENPRDRKKFYGVYLRSFRLDDNEVNKAQFDASYPLGFFAFIDAYNRRGDYGKWLLSLPFVIKINDNLFTHGGLSPAIADMSLKEINEEQKDDLEDYLRIWDYYLKEKLIPFNAPFYQRPEFVKQTRKDRNRRIFLRAHESVVFSSRSTAWYRGNVHCHPYFEEDRLKQHLTQLDANRLWIGHTPTLSKQVETRLSGILTNMDTGMLASYYRGQPWFAIIQPDGNFEYIHGVTGEQGTTVVAKNREYMNPYRWSDKKVEDFLKTADIVAMEETEEGRTNPYRVTLKKGKRQIQAIFKYRDTEPLAERIRWKNSMEDADRFQYEIAAYKLDRLLGIGLVPVTVERTVNDTEGVLQLWIDDLTSYLEINDTDGIYRGLCRLSDQINFLDSFDYLIANVDRNQSNILFSKSDRQIWFIDHSKAFGTSTKRPPMMKRSDVTVTPRFKRALETLTEENLEQLRPWLNVKQIEAILKRRDKMLRDAI